MWSSFVAVLGACVCVRAPECGRRLAVHAMGEAVPNWAVSVYGATGGCWTLVRRGWVVGGFLWSQGSVSVMVFIDNASHLLSSPWLVAVWRTVRRGIGGWLATGGGGAESFLGRLYGLGLYCSEIVVACPSVGRFLSTEMKKLSLSLVDCTLKWLS